MGLTQCEVPGLDLRLASRSALGATGPLSSLPQTPPPRIEDQGVNAQCDSTRNDARVEDVPRADIFRAVIFSCGHIFFISVFLLVVEHSQ